MLKNVKFYIALIVVVIIVIFCFIIFFNNKDTVNRPKNNSSLIMLGGELVDFNDSEITIKNLSDDILNEEAQDVDYVIKIASNTKIIRYTDNKKSQKVFLKEQLDYKKRVAELKKHNKNTFGIEGPNWYISENITINNLSPGDNLMVLALKENDINIARKIILETKEETKQDVAFLSVKKRYEGKIEKIDAEAKMVLADIFGEKKELKYNQDSIFFIKTKKSKEQFIKEQNEFNEKHNNKEDTSEISAPSWYDVKEIEINNLNIGKRTVIYVIADKQGEIIEKLEIYN